MTYTHQLDDLVERDAELSVLEALLEAARGGRGSFLVIEGPAGIGKTCLVQQARARAEASGMNALGARGSELERDFPFGVVRQLFEPLLAAVSDADRSDLLSGPARFAERALGDSLLAVGAEEEDASYATLHGLYWLAVNVAQRSPALIAVDDAHWSDAASQRWLAHLTKRIEAIPVLLLLTVKHTEPGPGRELVDELASDPFAQVLRPAPLSQSAVSGLVRAALSSDAAEEFCSACHRVTRGNPFLLRELLTELAFEGLAPTAENAPHVATLGPKTITRFVLARLARLPRIATSFAHAAAVLGDVAELRQIAELAGLDQQAAAEAAHTLMEIEILRDGGRVVFAHPVVRAAIYADLRLPERAHAHAVAAHLLQAEGAPADRVASQLLAAQCVGDSWAVNTLRNAARAALARGAREEAVTYLRRALAEPPAAGERVDLLLELGRAELHVHGLQGLHHLREAFELTEDPARRAQIALELGRSLAMVADWRGAARVLDDAISELGSGHRELVMELAAELVSVSLADALTSGMARERLTRVREEFGGELPANQTLLASVAIAVAAEGTSRDEALSLAERALGTQPQVDQADPRVLAMIGSVLAWTGELDVAMNLWNEALAVARRRGSVLLFATASCFRSDVARRIGLLGEAEADARAAFEALSPSSWGSPALVYPIAFLVETLVERSDLATAEEAVRQAGVGDDLPELAQFNRFMFSRGGLRLAQGRTREGIDDLLECGRRLEALGVRNPAVIPWRSSAALALLALDEVDEARRLAGEELALARRFGNPVAIGVALRAAGLIEDGDPGVELLREAVTVLQGTSSSIELARMLIDLGAALRRKGKRIDARAPLRDGRDLALRCAATSLAERAHEELVAAGGRPRRAMAIGASALTASEDRVTRLAAEGMTNREIARALFVTDKTVEMHLSNAYQKLDIRSRSQLANALRP